MTAHTSDFPTFSFEAQLWDRGHPLVAGVDEVGRGPLAGPVVAAAVILPQNCTITGLQDSKQLTPRQREALYDQIQEEAVAVGIAQRDHETVDRVNILRATLECMRLAVADLSTAPTAILVDGNQAPAIDIPMTTLVKGDCRSCSIAAASIIAKVTRDRLMRAFDGQYPVYGFSSHKGYASARHISAIRTYGLSPIHRRTFCRKILNPQLTQLTVFH